MDTGEKTRISTIEMLNWMCCLTDVISSVIRHPSSVIRHRSHINWKKDAPKDVEPDSPPRDRTAEILLYYLFISKGIYSYLKIQKSKTQKTGSPRHLSVIADL